jgi:hypothetical protein
VVPVVAEVVQLVRAQMLEHTKSQVVATARSWREDTDAVGVDVRSRQVVACGAGVGLCTVGHIAVCRPCPVTAASKCVSLANVFKFAFSVGQSRQLVLLSHPSTMVLAIAS